MPVFFQGLMTEFAVDLSSALVYIAIVAVFLTAMVKCVLPVMRSRKILRRAARQIRHGADAKRSWQEQDFLGKGALYPHWCEYLNNLFFADGEFHNPSNIEDFINEDTAIYEPGRSHFAEAAPGIMVSLGFLGTLIGIASGLKGFSMDDAEQVMQAIRQLVPGMQYAFMTSIVGVIGSITTTLIARIADGAAHGALNDFYDALKKHAGVVSVEPMTQIAIYQQEQTALIQNLVTGLSGALAERMAEQMGTAVGRAMGSMQQSLDDFMAHTTREQLRGVDIIVQRFIHEMNMSVNGQFEQLARTIDDTNKGQREMGENVKRAMDGLSRVSQGIASAAQLSGDMVTKMDGYLARLNANQQLAQDAYGRVSSNVEHLEVVARQQNAYLQSVGKLQGEIAEALERFENASTQFMGFFGESSSEAAKSMREAAGAIAKSGEQLSVSHKALTGGIAKDIDRTYNNFFKATNESVEHLTWLMEDVKNTMSRLPDTMDAAANLYAHQADRLSDALRRTQAALDDAVDRMAQAMYTNR